MSYLCHVTQESLSPCTATTLISCLGHARAARSVPDYLNALGNPSTAFGPLHMSDTSGSRCAYNKYVRVDRCVFFFLQSFISVSSVDRSSLRPFSGYKDIETATDYSFLMPGKSDVIDGAEKRHTGEYEMYSNLYALYKFPYTSQQFIFVLGLLGKISCRFGPGCAVSLKKSQPVALN